MLLWNHGTGVHCRRVVVTELSLSQRICTNRAPGERQKNGSPPQCPAYKVDTLSMILRPHRIAIWVPTRLLL